MRSMSPSSILRELKMERTLVLIKPDGVCKRLIGEVIRKIELEGEKKAREFYRSHKGKHFFQGLIDFMLTAPSVALIVEGEGVVKKLREIIGERKPEDASPETIRGKYASDGRRNIVHGSDSPFSAEQEIRCLFNPEEIYSYDNSEPG